MARRGRNNKQQGKSRGEGGLLQAVGRMVSNGFGSLAEPDDSLDALDLLKAQHRYVDKLFSRIQSARGQAKAAAFRELADMLAIHAIIEEKIFYPSVKSAGTRELVTESAEEHLGMKRTLADMLELDSSSDEFDAKLSVLEEQVHHHAIEEEEGKLFPIVRREQEEDFRAGLAGEMIALMVELDQMGNARLSVPAETDEPAHI